MQEGPPRRRPWRALGFLGVAALIVGLAFLVARPRAEPPAATPYAGARGASRARAAGLEVFYWRAGALAVAQPGTPLRAGDVLRFVVRGERPRYLVVRLRDGGAAPAVVFPSGPVAALVPPGETLPGGPTLSAGSGQVTVSALFADQPFAVTGAPGPDTLAVTVELQKGP